MVGGKCELEQSLAFRTGGDEALYFIFACPAWPVRLALDQRTDPLAPEQPFQIARLEQIENHDGQALVHA
ncbi:hypothetical protein DESA109040_16510 [Deinococcus saxicola]